MSRCIITCPHCREDFPEDDMYAPNDWNSHKCPKQPIGTISKISEEYNELILRKDAEIETINIKYGKLISQLWERLKYV